MTFLPSAIIKLTRIFWKNNKELGLKRYWCGTDLRHFGIQVSVFPRKFLREKIFKSHRRDGKERSSVQFISSSLPFYLFFVFDNWFDDIMMAQLKSLSCAILNACNSKSRHVLFWLKLTQQFALHFPFCFSQTEKKF